MRPGGEVAAVVAAAERDRRNTCRRLGRRQKSSLSWHPPREIVRDMKRLLPVAIAAALLLAGSSSAKQEHVLLGIVPQNQSGFLARLDPMTLEPLPGRRVKLDSPYWAWAFNPGRSLLVLGRSWPASLRFVDPNRLVAGRTLRLDPYGIRGVVALAWLTRHRVVAVLDEHNVLQQNNLSVLTVDADARRVVKRRRLRGIVKAAVHIPRALVLLVVPKSRLAAARLAVVDVRGRLRVRKLRRIVAGAGVATRASPIARRQMPGLAVDPVGRRAYVVSAGAPVATVDLKTLTTRYHNVRRPASTFKPLEGTDRDALWLGGGVLAVSGSNERRQGQAFAYTPAGLDLVDTRTWTSRTIETRASGFVFASGILLAYGWTWQSGQEEPSGMGLAGFGIDGVERFRLFGDAVLFPQSAGGLAYVWPGGRGGAVVDLATGRVIGELAGLPRQLLVGHA
jgi:hypothetical protein